MVDDVKKRSVTANDSGDVRGAPVFHWMLSYQPTAGTGDLPAWWSPARDWYLRQTIERESFWAGALSIAVTKMSSLAWELDSDAPRVRNYFQELLLAADNNQSWVNFLARHLMDFLCTDNGAFVEVVRATSAAGSRILGLVHLDSLRCTRTGDPDYPVRYRDTKGVNHEMQPHQVIVFSDMPDPSETYYGVGHCAASRAYRGILKMAAIETYIYEKVSGKRALAVDLVGGISDKQLATAVTSAEEERVGKGYVSYMGAIVVPTLSDVAITHTRINFAELPDGFDREKEFNIGLLQYANAIGLDPQELQPLTGAALGTGTQAEVLSEKGKGKGLAAWRQQWTHAVNQFVLPDSVTFAFDENDLKDSKQKADISKTRADAMGVYIDKGIVTPSQAAQILADEGEIPDEFVPADQTPGGTLTDSEKPESEADQAEAQAEQAQVAAPAPTTEQMKQRTKEHTGVMVAFLVSEGIGKPLLSSVYDALPDGSELSRLDELHLTLAYLGDSASIETTPETLAAVLRVFASEHSPVRGKIGGIGRMDTIEGNNTTALYTMFDSPDLPKFRQDLVETLQAAGIPVDETHGFVPHITLAYIPSDATKIPAEVQGASTTFGHIILAWGQNWTAITLTETPQEQAVKERLVEFDAAMKEFREAMKGKESGD